MQMFDKDKIKTFSNKHLHSRFCILEIMLQIDSQYNIRNKLQTTEYFPAYFAMLQIQNMDLTHAQFCANASLYLLSLTEESLT